MPAVLIEAGFLSHPVEGKKIFTAEYRKQMARPSSKGFRVTKSSGALIVICRAGHLALTNFSMSIVTKPETRARRP